MRKDSKTLIFLHIPKTGGRTFYNILIRQFSNSEIFNLQHLFSLEANRSEAQVFFNSNLQRFAVNKLKQITLKEKERIKCLTQGHLGFGLHRFFPQETLYVTFLRNPVDQVISNYYYLRRRPNNPFYRKIKGKDLKDFVENAEATDHFSNIQTRFLCGENGIPKLGKLSEKDLRLAEDRLKKNFAFVGTTERFDESLLCIKKIFGWRNVYYYKSNISKNRPPLKKMSKDIIKNIERRNQLDIALYEFAKKVVENKIKNYGPSFNVDIESFRKKLPIFSKLLYFKRILSAPPGMYKNKLLLKIGEIKAALK